MRFALPCALRKICAHARSGRATNMERHLQCSLAMTTIGQLVSVLFTRYESKFHDKKLAAVATRAAIEEMLKRRRRAAKGADHALAR